MLFGLTGHSGPSGPPKMLCGIWCVNTELPSALHNADSRLLLDG